MRSEETVGKAGDMSLAAGDLAVIVHLLIQANENLYTEISMYE